jgi:DNA-binding transcriptional regulator YiaG
MTKKKSKEKISQGRRTLLAALQKTSRRSMAKRMKVSTAAVSRWASGVSRPNELSQGLLKDTYGIAGSW